MTFKKLRGIRLDYAAQGYIYFLCRNYYRIGDGDRSDIDVICAEVGGAYGHALFRVLTSEASIRRIAVDEFVSEATLYRLRARFYLRAWEEMLGRK